MKHRKCLYTGNIYTVLLLFGVILNFVSCAESNFNPPDFMSEHVGNGIDIILNDKTEHNGLELLFINDDTLYTLKDNSKIIHFNIKDINVITVNGYSDRSWIIGVAAFQVVPAIVMGLAASTINGKEGGGAITAIFLIPAVIEILFFETSTPKSPELKQPDKNNISVLRKYARYPQELTREQINFIENFYERGIRK